MNQCVIYMHVGINLTISIHLFLQNGYERNKGEKTSHSSCCWLDGFPSFTSLFFEMVARKQRKLMRKQAVEESQKGDILKFWYTFMMAKSI